MGNWGTQKQHKDMIRQEIERQVCENEEQIQNFLVNVARQTFPAESDNFCEKKPTDSKVPVLFASFTHERGLEIKRITT
jgi:hypothetical protein